MAARPQGQGGGSGGSGVCPFGARSRHQRLAPGGREPCSSGPPRSRRAIARVRRALRRVPGRGRTRSGPSRASRVAGGEGWGAAGQAFRGGPREGSRRGGAGGSEQARTKETRRRDQETGERRRPGRGREKRRKRSEEEERGRGTRKRKKTRKRSRYAAAVRGVDRLSHRASLAWREPTPQRRYDVAGASSWPGECTAGQSERMVPPSCVTRSSVSTWARD